MTYIQMCTMYVYVYVYIVHYKYVVFMIFM